MDWKILTYMDTKFYMEMQKTLLVNPHSSPHQQPTGKGDFYMIRTQRRFHRDLQILGDDKNGHDLNHLQRGPKNQL